MESAASGRRGLAAPVDGHRISGRAVVVEALAGSPPVFTRGGSSWTALFERLRDRPPPAAS
jgi:hypothetical protein